MAISDNAQMQIISDALGTADAQFQAALDTTIVSSSTYVSNEPAGNVVLVRELVRAQTTTNDLDAANTLQNALRSAEKNIPTAISSLLSSSARGLDTYCKDTSGNKLRVQFKTGVSWSENFRNLWRRAMSEELVVRLAAYVNSSGSWSATDLGNNKTIQLDSALELRATTSIGSSPITITLTLTRATNAIDVVSITVPAGTPSGTVFTIKGTSSKYVSVSNPAFAGGSNGDRLEVWVS